MCVLILTVLAVGLGASAPDYSEFGIEIGQGGPVLFPRAAAAQKNEIIVSLVLGAGAIDYFELRIEFGPQAQAVLPRGLDVQTSPRLSRQATIVGLFAVDQSGHHVEPVHISASEMGRMARERLRDLCGDDALRIALPAPMKPNRPMIAVFEHSGPPDFDFRPKHDVGLGGDARKSHLTPYRIHGGIE
jgi:hypothetical protein